MKALIITKNSDNKCFLWCYIKHLNPLKIHPERITKIGKNMVNDLDYKGIEFPVSCLCINVFCYENYLVYPVYVSNENFENCMDLLMITNINRSHYVYVKYFNRLK